MRVKNEELGFVYIYSLVTLKFQMQHSHLITFTFSHHFVSAVKKMRQGHPPATKTRHAMVPRPGVCRGGPTPDELSSQDRQELQGRFPARILYWEHSIPYPSPIPAPLEDERQRGESLHVPILKIPPLSSVGFSP